MTDQTLTNVRHKVLVVSDDATTIAAMQSSLSALSMYDVETIDMRAIYHPRSDFDLSRFDVVVIDVGDGSMLETDLVASLPRLLLGIPTIVVSDPLSDQRMRLLLKLNSRDWLPKPLDRRSLLDAVTANAIVGHVRRDNYVVAVVSGSAGAGGTSVAVSLAEALIRASTKTNSRVALVDLDFTSADSGTYVGAKCHADLRPALADPSRIDAEFLDILKQTHASGFAFYSFKQPEISLSPRGSELVLRMLDVVSFQHDLTVVDVPYYETPWKDELLGGVDAIYLVATLTVPSLQLASETYQRIRNFGNEECPIHVIANRRRRKFLSFTVGKKDTRRLFADTKVVFIDDDWETMSEALNLGVLPRQVNARSAFVRSVDKLAELTSR